MAIQGIDISTYQGTVDWRHVAAAGIEFACIKATEGLQKDPAHEARGAYFRANWAKARRAGLALGAYHFFRADQDSELQADLFIQSVAAVGGADLVPMLDVEATYKTTNELIVTRVRRWLEKVEAEIGAAPLVYTNAGFWSEHLNDTFGRYPLWIAAYGADEPTEPTVPDRDPALPPGWSKWTIWQYCSKGHVGGIAAPVDLNLFDGGLADLPRVP
jgi:lysozyme